MKAEKELAECRKSIDNIDSALLFMLAERFRITEKIGRIKKEQHLPAEDREREKQQLDRLNKLSEEVHLNKDFIRSFFKLITTEVKRNHECIRKEQ